LTKTVFTFETNSSQAIAKIKSNLRTVGWTLALLSLTGCAGVSVTPLNADGTEKEDAKKGIRYYMPMPYLLVVEMPPPLGSKPGGNYEGSYFEEQQNSDSSSRTPVPNTNGSSPAILPDNKSAAAPKTQAKKQTPTPKPGPGESSTPAAAAVTDTSFVAQTPQYIVKLIYLPDLSRSMALEQSTGLFGTSQMQPVLQDGWMLTSLNASADSKVAETLTALAAITGAVVTKGATGAMQQKSMSMVAPNAALPPTLPENALRPGLYRFKYNEEGVLTGLIPVAFFGRDKGAWRP